MKKKTKKKLLVIPAIIANAAIVLGAVYILFYILDIYNPMYLFLDEHIWITRYLDIIVAGLALVLGILFIVCTWELYTKKPKHHHAEEAPVKKKKHHSKNGTHKKRTAPVEETEEI